MIGCGDTFSSIRLVYPQGERNKSEDAAVEGLEFIAVTRCASYCAGAVSETFLLDCVTDRRSESDAHGGR